MALDAGGLQVGPIRTLEAYRAIVETTRDTVLPQLLDPRSNRSTLNIPIILRTLFERLGATYIKLGQFVASSPTLFPPEYVREFQKCLDQTTPLPWSTIQSIIVAELGPLESIFSFVDPIPLASASIAQVHRATLRSTGEQVVLKVQKPGIDKSLKADLGFIYIAARVLEFIQPDLERTSLSAVASDIRTSMLEELDFEKEAQNTIEFGRFLRENGLTSRAVCPRVYPAFTTKKVLTLEYLDGQSLLDESTIARVNRSQDQSFGAETIITALNIWSLSVTNMPWFHADVHAGNLLLLNDGRVGFIDFGIVGKISPKVFQAVNELSTALVLNDSLGMANALCNMGAADDTVDREKFGQDIQRVLNKMQTIQPDVTISATSDYRTLQSSINFDEAEITDLLLEFVQVTEDNGLKLPREFGLLVKQVLYFDRYMKILAPNLDVMNDDRIMIGGQQRESPLPLKR
jgi:aarF domain-containing kinase